MADFVEVAKLEEVPPGRSTTITVAGKDIALFNVDGIVYATNDGCLHAGASLGFDGKLEGKIVTCRRHGWKFDVTTGNLPSVPGMSLGCYPVKVEQDKIFVQV
jgi:nitrite reductase/ring-hydroxylating ferredoxin subunit